MSVYPAINNAKLTPECSDTPRTDAKANRIRMQTVAPTETALDFARELEREIAALREALKHQRTALMIVRDRQDGRASRDDLTKGIGQIDAALEGHSQGGGNG